KYLLDTNHLSAYLDRQAALEKRIDTALRAGDRVGICLPVLCEYRSAFAWANGIGGTSLVCKQRLAVSVFGPRTNRPPSPSPSYFKSCAPPAKCCPNLIC